MPANLVAANKALILHTYGILLAQVAVAFLILWKIRDHPPVSRFFCHIATYLAVFVVTLMVLIAFFVMRDSLGYYGQLAALGVLTVLMALSVQCATGQVAWGDALRILEVTVAVFVAMSAAGYATLAMGWDLGWMGWILTAVLLGLIVAGVVFLFHPPSTKASRVYYMIGTVLFSLYVAFHTNQIVRVPGLTAPEAALQFFLDFLNLFLNLLGGSQS